MPRTRPLPRGKLIFYTALATTAVCYLLFWSYLAWQEHGVRNRLEAQKLRAQELALSYNAVRSAPMQLANQPVLWRLGMQGAYGASKNWYYKGELNKPVFILNPPDPELPREGHHGMDFHLILGLVRGGGEQGVFLEYLRYY